MKCMQNFPKARDNNPCNLYNLDFKKKSENEIYAKMQEYSKM